MTDTISKRLDEYFFEKQGVDNCELVKIVGDVATMEGKLQAVDKVETDPVWRREYLQKLLIAEGYTSKEAWEVSSKHLRKRKRK